MSQDKKRLPLTMHKMRKDWFDSTLDIPMFNVVRLGGACEASFSEQRSTLAVAGGKYKKTMSLILKVQLFKLPYFLTPMSFDLKE